MLGGLGEWGWREGDPEEVGFMVLGNFVTDENEGGVGFWLVHPGGRRSHFLRWGPGGTAGLGMTIGRVWVCETFKVRCQIGSQIHRARTQERALLKKLMFEGHWHQSWKWTDEPKESTDREDKMGVPGSQSQLSI